tara:strand:+ start:1533 stop:2519 length:987 start_codon:yes stop_codon:yes gene_type:complete
MTEEQYLLEVDSSQRDTAKYPNPNDYIVTVNRPMYSINQIRLIAARIPLSQWTIDAFNNKITVWDGATNTVVSLTTQDYLTGAALAAQLTLDFLAAGLTLVITVTFNVNTGALTFSGTAAFSLITGANSAAQVLGLLPNATTVAVGGPPFIIVGDSIDIDGPTSLILSLNGDERDDIKNDLYVTGVTQKPMHYFGRIITTQYTSKRLIDYNGHDDPVRHNFYRGAEDFIETFHVRFYCNNFDEVHPYDFKLRNHILKFEILCTLDKLVINSEYAKNKKMVALPPPLDIGRFGDQYRILGDRKIMVYGGSIVVVVLLVIILTSFKQRRV